MKATVDDLFAEIHKDDGGILTNPHARFYFEPSRKHGGRLLHIRCGYNNKYWMAKQQQQQPDDGAAAAAIVITGTATEREEDLGKPSCTLFAVQLKSKGKDEAQNILYDASFYDPRLGKPALIAGQGEDEEGKLHGEFVVRDLSDHVVLPRYVAFKGYNDMYLSARQVHGGSYLQFSEEDIAASRAMFTTYHKDDGTVRLKSKAYDKFMKFDTNWVTPVGRDDAGDKRTLFKVIKVGDYYGLKCMGNHKFCKSLSADGKTDCLNAADSHITEEVKLWVTEPVLSREIYDVVYHGVDKARVYDMKTINMATSSAVNRTSENNKVKLSLSITQTQTSTWDASVSLKAGVKTTVTAGIPAVMDAEVEVSFEVTSEYHWGKTEVNETKQQIVYDVVVPTKKKVTVSAIASQAKCDVPFSYTEKDVLPTGEVRITKHHDGIYTGMNTFNLQYETKEEDLPATE